MVCVSGNMSGAAALPLSAHVSMGAGHRLVLVGDLHYVALRVGNSLFVVSHRLLLLVLSDDSS